jgi:tetratricopeptide (TPR) repeat protein
MREALPPMDNLARALLMRGARDAAVMLLRAASRRGGEERSRCEGLLAAILARPTDRVSGPPIHLDAELVEAIAASGRLYEAHAVALGADMSRNVAGVEIAAALEEIFLSYDDWSNDWKVRWQDALASGSLSSMSNLDREVSVAHESPAPLRARAALALRLLRGFSLTSATHVRDPLGDLELPELGDDARKRIIGLIGQRDLPGALREAHAMAFEGRAGANEVAIVLGRLVSAAEKAMVEGAGPKLASTVPLGGSGMALFQLRMGNLTEALRLFRLMLAENPSDYAARECLTDLVALEGALGMTKAMASQEPPARAPSTEWLDKKQRKASMQGWASTSKPALPVQSTDWDDDDPSTSVMKSDHEAELLLKSGHPDRALALYEQLVHRYPDRPRFAQRRDEIQSMVQERSAPLAMESTVRGESPPAPKKLKREDDPLAQTDRNDEGISETIDAPKELLAEMASRPAAALVPEELPSMPLAAAPAPVERRPATVPPSRPSAIPPSRPSAIPPSRPLAGGAIPASRPRLRPQSEPVSTSSNADVHSLEGIAASVIQPAPAHASQSRASQTTVQGVTVRRIVPVG